MSDQINGHTFHYAVADDVVADLKRYAEHLVNSQAQARRSMSGYVAPAAPCPTCHRCPTCGHYGNPYQWTFAAPPADRFTVFNGLPGQGGLESWQQTAAGNTDNSTLSGCS